MLKYVDSKIVFAEVPDEVSLAINISNCPFMCKGCHSHYLSKDIGTELDVRTIDNLIEDNKGITCVCIMGGDSEPLEVDGIAACIKDYYPNLKVAWYSGNDIISKDINLKNFDYVKIGHYDESKGPLNSKITNQRMYKIDIVNNKAFTKDITSRFWN